MAMNGQQQQQYRIDRRLQRQRGAGYVLALLSR